MPSYSLWDVATKPYVEEYFVLPKALGRTAIRDGLALTNMPDNAVSGHDAKSCSVKDHHHHSALVSLSVQ